MRKLYTIQINDLENNRYFYRVTGDRDHSAYVKALRLYGAEYPEGRVKYVQIMGDAKPTSKKKRKIYYNAKARERRDNLEKWTMSSDKVFTSLDDDEEQDLE